MSFNNVRRALDELDAVANRDKLVAKIEKLEKQNLELTHETTGPTTKTSD